MPDRYRNQIDGAETTAFANLPWWEVYQDHALTALIEEALANNRDLRTAAARVEQARSLVAVARADLLPQLSYDGAIGILHSFSQFAILVPRGETSEGYRGAFNLAWELDVWGRIRHATDAAVADLLATEEFRRAVVLSLVSDVAQAYFELRELDLELEIARRTTESFQRTLDLFSRRLQLGVASKLETARAEAALAATAAVVPTLEQLIVFKENQLSVLTGRTPAPIARGAALTNQGYPPKTPAGLPAQLLERRPDIRQAEQTLIGANARIGVAYTNFFPRIGLTSFVGGADPEIENVVKDTGSIWAAAGQLVGPIVQGGRLSGNYHAARAQWEQAKEQYSQSILIALQEVSNALTAQQKLAEARREQERAVEALRESVRLATLRYTGGLANYFEIIEAQQQLFPAENTLARIQRDQLIAVVQLYKALGGGWEANAHEVGLPSVWEAVISP